MNAFDLLVLVLAAYRLWMLIAKDAITQRWRQRLLGYDDTGSRNRWPHPHKRLAEFVHCPWCSGAWLSALVYLSWRLFPDGVMWILTPLAISAGVALISVCFDRLVLDNK